VGDEICSGFGDLIPERDRAFLVVAGAAAASFATSADFDTDRDLRLRVGVASEP
jgi:hypothetical protein